MAKPIGTLGVIDTLTIGGRVYTDLTNLIIISAAGASSLPRGTTFRKQGGSSGYQVTTGKTLTITSMVTQPAVASVQPNLIGYCDNDVGINTATAFTNPVYINGDSTFSGIQFVAPSTIAYNPAPINLSWPIPALKYAFVSWQNAALMSIIAYGYET